MIRPFISSLLLGVLLAAHPIQHATFFGQNVGTGTTPLNPCLITAWPMNEGTGTTLNDVSGSANTATINTGASVTWTANAIKTGVTSPVWAGTGYANSSNTALTNFTNVTPFSVFFWVKGTQTPPFAVIGNINIGAFQGWLLNENPGGLGGKNITVSLTSSVSNYLQTNSVGFDLADGNLHYAGFTYDGSQNTSGLKTYYDGADTLAGSTFNSLSASIASGQPTQIAAFSNVTQNYQGAMGYVEIYNCVVTPTQVATYFASGPGIY